MGPSALLSLREQLMKAPCGGHRIEYPWQADTEGASFIARSSVTHPELNFSSVHFRINRKKMEAENKPARRESVK